MALHIVVMAGGSGTRFWPLSRRQQPKQVLALAGERALIADTLSRVASLGAKLWICCGVALEQPIRDAIGDDFDVGFILEPEARDTTACIALAAGRVLAQGEPDDVIAFLPADHAIETDARFCETLSAAADHAGRSGRLVVIGIEPTFPSEGFGYIEFGDAVHDENEIAIHRVLRFREKPNEQQAAAWIAAGNFCWNGGFVVAQLAALREALSRHAPDAGNGLDTIEQAARSGDAEAEHAAFRRIDKISFDYAVLEKSDAVDVVRADFEWDDLGSFEAIAARTDASEDSNKRRLDAGLTAILEECKDTLVVGRGAHVVAGLGLERMLVVHTPDATLICPLDRAQEVRKLVDQLRAQGREDVL